MTTILHTKKNALILGIIALCCSTLSLGVYWATKDRIAEQMKAQKEALFSEVIESSYYDNDLLTTCQAPWGDFQQIPSLKELCVAKKAGKTAAYIFETIAPEGYAGNIHLLVALTPQGEVLGVRTIEHHETPGLGDKIETKHSDWILSFAHKMLSPDTLERWAVKKDGGEFDQFTGATITPRIVVNQVKTASLAVLDVIHHHPEEIK